MEDRSLETGCSAMETLFPTSEECEPHVKFDLCDSDDSEEVPRIPEEEEKDKNYKDEE